jgi:hypothetical protein
MSTYTVPQPQHEEEPVQDHGSVSEGAKGVSAFSFAGSLVPDVDEP